MSTDAPTDLAAPADLAALRSALVPTGRPLIVNHWATWCPPCVDELPLLVEAAHLLDGRADLLGISWDLFERHGEDPADAAREVAAFAGHSGLPYRSLVFTGEPHELFDGLGLEFQMIPQTFVFDASGDSIRHIAGVIDRATLDEIVSLVGA